MEPSAKALDDLANDLIKDISIVWREENILPMVAAQRDVLERRWNMQA